MDVLVYLQHRHIFSSPGCLVTQPASITLVETSLEGCLKLAGAGHQSPNITAGLLSLQKGQSVATSDGSVVEHHTWATG